MSDISKLRRWIERDLPRSKVESAMAYYTVGGDAHFKIYLYTDTNKYSIYAREGVEMDYLGAMAQSRKYRPGEDWFRGNDLPDGKISEKTWNEILKSIVRYELQDIVKKDARKNHADNFGPAESHDTLSDTTVEDLEETLDELHREFDEVLKDNNDN